MQPSLLALSWDRAVLDTKEFVRSRDQMFFIFAFPVFMLVLLGSIFGDQELASGVTFSQYLTAGLIASGVLNSGFQSLAITLAMDRENDTLKHLRGTPLPPLAFFLGKVVHILAVTFVQVVLLIAVGMAFYGLELPQSPTAWLTFAWVFLLGTSASTVLGLAASSLPRSARSASAIVTPIVLVLQFISGVFFVYTQLPEWMQNVAQVFPLKWLAQGMRSVFLPESFASAEAAGSWQLPLTALVLFVWLVAGLVLAVRTFRWQRAGDN